MGEKRIRLFKLPNGKEPFNQWLNKVKDKKEKIRILRRLDRLALGQYGDVKALKNNLFELRFHFSSGYRIYFTEQGGEIIILLLGGNKTTQIKDIKLARDYLDYLREVIENE